MILSEIRTLVTGFTRYLDNYVAASPSPTELTAQVNWGVRHFARKLHLFDPRISLTLNSVASTNDTIYNIRDTVGLSAGPYTVETPSTPVVSKRVVKPYVVFIDGQPLLDWNGSPGLWSLSQLEERYPTWRTGTTGTVAIAVYLGNGRLLLYPPPSAAGSNHFISGTYLPADLVVTTDDAKSPDLPDELHEALAYFVAQHVAMPTVTEGEAWTRLKAYNAEWFELVSEIATENRNAVEGPWLDTGWKYGKTMMV